MEEISGTGALEREILADAARKAERVLKKAFEEAETFRKQAAEETEGRLSQMRKAHTGKLSQMEIEAMSRLPLEMTRLRMSHIDRELRKAVRHFLDALEPASFGAWCLAELGGKSAELEGRDVNLRTRGLDASTVARIANLHGLSLASPPVEDAALDSRGVLIESADGAMSITVDENLLEERLLDERRGELASALFPTLVPAQKGASPDGAGGVAESAAGGAGGAR